MGFDPVVSKSPLDLREAVETKIGHAIVINHN